MPFVIAALIMIVLSGCSSKELEVRAFTSPYVSYGFVDVSQKGREEPIEYDMTHTDPALRIDGRDVVHVTVTNMGMGMDNGGIYCAFSHDQMPQTETVTTDQGTFQTTTYNGGTTLAVRSRWKYRIESKIDSESGIETKVLNILVEKSR